MKRLLWIAVCLALSCTALAQDGYMPVERIRLFSPRDMVWGYGQFDVAPPHNEPDPNLCAANAGTYGGKDAPCNAFGRYLLSAYV